MKLRSLLLGAAVAASMASTAGAHSILVAQKAAPTPDGTGGFNYTYSVTLAGGSAPNQNAIKAGDFFVLYDIVGLKGTPTFTNASFTGTTPLTTTPQPPLQAAPDSPTIPNVVFTYTGAGLTTASGGTDIPLGTLTIDSAYGSGGNNVVYSGQDENGPSATAQGNSGFVNGPVVPASNAGLGGAALLGLLGVARLIKSRRAAV